jgi:protein phosphatase 1 regulatory subunit 7
MPTTTTFWRTSRTRRRCARCQSFGFRTEPSVQEVELVHARLASTDNLRLARFAPHLKRLCLRENFLSSLDVEVFQLFTKLEELDFYDNKLKSVDSALNNMTELTCVSLAR